MPKADWSEKLSGFLLGAFGPGVVRGIIGYYLEQIPPAECRKYILENKSLLASVTEKQWDTVRKAAKTSRMNLTYEEVITQLQKHRPDVLGIISTTNGGVMWLRRQVKEAQQKISA